jgi:hypothetical protein
MAHAYNPSYLEGTDRNILVQGKSRQKVSKTPSQKISWA